MSLWHKGLGGKNRFREYGLEGACHAATKQKENSQIHFSAICPDSVSYIGIHYNDSALNRCTPLFDFFDFLGTQNNRLR